MPPEQPDNTDMLIRSAREADFPAIAQLVTSPEELFRVFPAGDWPHSTYARSTGLPSNA
jgi:hypothetical protein